MDGENQSNRTTNNVTVNNYFLPSGFTPQLPFMMSHGSFPVPSFEVNQSQFLGYPYHGIPWSSPLRASSSANPTQVAFQPAEKQTSSDAPPSNRKRRAEDTAREQNKRRAIVDLRKDDTADISAVAELHRRVDMTDKYRQICLDHVKVDIRTPVTKLKGPTWRKAIAEQLQKPLSDAVVATPENSALRVCSMEDLEAQIHCQNKGPILICSGQKILDVLPYLDPGKMIREDYQHKMQHKISVQDSSLRTSHASAKAMPAHEVATAFDGQLHHGNKALNCLQYKTNKIVGEIQDFPKDCNLVNEFLESLNALEGECHLPADRAKLGEFTLFALGGARTGLHMDDIGLDTWIINAKGRQLFGFVQDPSEEYITELSHKQNQSLAERASYFVLTLLPGDMLYIPAGLLHFVVRDEPTMTYGGRFLHKQRLVPWVQTALRLENHRGLTNEDRSDLLHRLIIFVGKAIKTHEALCAGSGKKGVSRRRRGPKNTEWMAEWGGAQAIEEFWSKIPEINAKLSDSNMNRLVLHQPLENQDVTTPVPRNSGRRASNKIQRSARSR